MIVRSLGTRARRVASHAGDPADARGSNFGLGHDLAVAIQRLVHQIVHALGTQFRVHSGEGQRRCGGLLVIFFDIIR